MLQEGRQVGNYRIEQLVGRGGQGFVYRAVHVQLGSKHALKLLLLEEGPLRERLLEEGRIQARLRHPNLVSVTDVLEVDGTLVLVADFVSGVSLDVWVATEHPPLDTRLEVFRGVCAAIEVAHAAMVVHRDLKPANVIVEMIEGRPIPRVTDFGVAKLLHPDAGPSVTMPGLPVGTPGYMAPEQLRDASSVDARADIFALGCLLYELACGVRPFPDANISAYALALSTGSYVALETCMPEVPPPEVVRTVAACLQLDPDARPADIDALLALLDGAPLETRPAHAAESASGPIQGTDSFVPRTATRAEGIAEPSSDTFASFEDTSATAFVMASLPPALRPRRRNMVWLVLTGAIVTTAVLTGAVFTALGWITNGTTAPRPSAEPTLAAVAATPVPVVPAPPEPAAKPAVERAAAPTNASAPRTGKVVSSGDGTIAWLVNGTQKYPPNDAPEGHYEVWARFPGAGSEVLAGNVSIRPGRTTRLKCDALQLRCRQEESP